MSAAAGHALPVSFTPHLLPVDRGILVTIYFRPLGGFIGNEAWLDKYRDFYAGEPFVEVSDAMPGLSEVAYTNFCRITVREDRAGRAGEGLQRHRQPGQGRVGTGRAEHELHVRVRRRRGPEEEGMSAYGGDHASIPVVVAPLESRFFPLPDGRGWWSRPAGSPGATFPAGFLAGGSRRRAEGERPPGHGRPGRGSRMAGKAASAGRLHDQRLRGGARRRQPRRRPIWRISWPWS